MLSNIYLLQFNNYFNRKIKKLDTLEEYTGQAVFTLTNTSFNPNDGINTSHVFNTSVACDYAVVTDVDGGNMTRWFVIENKRNRAGQYTVLLRRDLVADYYDSILDSPCYIEKATVSASDSAIYNKEGAGYNQIKQSETLLKDEYATKWLVAFVAKNRTQDYTFTATQSITSADITVAGIKNWEYYSLTQKEAIYNPKQILCEIRSVGSLSTQVFNVTGAYDRYSYLDYVSTSTSSNSSTTLRKLKLKSYDQTKAKAIFSAISTSDYYTDAGIDISMAYGNYVNAISGKIIYDSVTQKYYKAQCEFGSKLYYYTTPVNSDLYLKLKTQAINSGIYTWANSGTEEDIFVYVITGDSIKVTLTEVSTTSTSWTLKRSDASDADNFKLKDQPFDIIMCPYEYDLGDGTYLRYNGATKETYVYNNTIALEFMSQLVSNTSLCYDLQVLPYMIPDKTISCITNNDGVTTALKFSDLTHAQIAGNNQNSVIFYYPQSSSFRSFINIAPIYVTEPKIQNECDLYRFVAPNYGSAFDFNIAMNGGLFGVEINCTYLPYQSYIHVNPTFNGLYGSDFNDQRGLVCGGNYSISATSDAWKEYVTNNKNYADIFDREIQNMEVNRSVQKVQEIGNAITGTVTGAMRGAITGANVGGGVGAVAGAVVGGVASGIGGVVDVAMSQKLYDESKSYKYDMQKYSLGNIQALPNSLARTSAYNVDNKYYPFIEYYTCTDEEKEALRNQIKYTGMTVRRVGKLRDYLQSDYSYMQGKMIMIDGLSDDYELLKAISEEIMQGVYLK